MIAPWGAHSLVAEDDFATESRDEEARLAQALSWLNPATAQNFSHLLSTYPSMEPDMAASFAASNQTVNTPWVRELAELGEEEHRNWLTRTVYDQLLVGGIRNTIMLTESLYNNALHTRGLRFGVGAYQNLAAGQGLGAAIGQAAEESEGSYLTQIQRAERAGEEWTMGTGFFPTPQDPLDVPEYRQAFEASVEAQSNAGRGREDVDLAAAHAAGLAAMPADIAARAHAAAERIKLTSSQDPLGLNPVPVSIGSLLTFQFLRPGGAPYAAVSGLLDMPLRLGADPLNVPFWEWEIARLSRRFARPLGDLGPARALDTAAEPLPPSLVSPVTVGDRTYATIDEFATDFEAAKASDDTERLTLLQGGLDNPELRDAWEAHRTAQSGPLPLPPVAEDPLAIAEADRLNSIPVSPEVLSTKRMKPFTQGITPLRVTEDPVAANGGWAVNQGLLNRLTETPESWAARRVDQLAPTRPNSQADRDAVYRVLASGPDALAGDNSELVTGFLANAGPEDFAWFEDRRTEVQSIIDDGLAAESQMLSSDRQLGDLGNWRRQSQLHSDEVLADIDRRVADLETGLAPRPAQEGIDFDVDDAEDVLAPDHSLTEGVPLRPEEEPFAEAWRYTGEPTEADLAEMAAETEGAPSAVISGTAAAYVPQVDRNIPVPEGVTRDRNVTIVNYDHPLRDDAGNISWLAPDDTRRRVMISGTRNKEGDSMDIETVREVIRQIAEQDPDTVIVHGSAAGVDVWADRAAQEFGLATERHPVTSDIWNRKPGGEKRKYWGHRRNRRMIEADIDEVWAFPATPEPVANSGTWGAIKTARSAGLDVTVVTKGQRPTVGLVGQRVTGRRAWSGVPPDPMNIEAIPRLRRMVEIYNQGGIKPELGPFRGTAFPDDVGDFGVFGPDVDITEQLGREATPRVTGELVGEEERFVPTYVERSKGTAEGLADIEAVEAAVKARVPDDLDLVDLENIVTRVMNKARTEGTQVTGNMIDQVIEQVTVGGTGMGGPTTRMMKKLEYRTQRRLRYLSTKADLTSEESREMVALQGLYQLFPGGRDYVPGTLGGEIRGLSPEASAQVARMEKELAERPGYPYTVPRSFADIGATEERIPIEGFEIVPPSPNRAKAWRTATLRPDQIQSLYNTAAADANLISPTLPTPADVGTARQRLATRHGALIEEEAELRRLYESGDTQIVAAVEKSRREIQAAKGGVRDRRAVVRLTQTEVEEKELLEQLLTFDDEQLVGTGYLEIRSFDDVDFSEYRILNLADDTRPQVPEGTVLDRETGELRDMTKNEREMAKQMRARHFDPEATERMQRQVAGEAPPELRILPAAEQAPTVDIDEARAALKKMRAAANREIKRLHQAAKESATVAAAQTTARRKIAALNVALNRTKPPLTDSARAAAIAEIDRITESLAGMTEPVETAHALAAAQANVKLYGELAALDDAELAAEVIAGRTPVTPRRPVRIAEADELLVEDLTTGFVRQVAPTDIDVVELRRFFSDRFDSLNVNGGNFRRQITPFFEAGGAAPPRYLPGEAEVVRRGPTTVVAAAPETNSVLPLARQRELDQLTQVNHKLDNKPIMSVPAAEEAAEPLPPQVVAAVERPDRVPPATHVANIKEGDPYDIYIGRKTSAPRGREVPGGDGKWGNKFDTGKVSERVARYRADLWRRIRAEPGLVDELAEMKGKTLGCFCANSADPKPKSCHGFALANAIDWAAKMVDELGPTAGWSPATVRRVLGTVEDAATAPIERFAGDYAFLSNFAPSPVVYEEITYPTTEHAFQAAKTFDLASRRRIAAAATPGAAKKMGRSVPLRPDWEAVKDQVMAELLEQKFAPGSDNAARLLATGERPLVEGNTWGDTYWGVSRGEGQNRLGRLLEEHRTALRSEEAAVGAAPAAEIDELVDPLEQMTTPSPVEEAERITLDSENQAWLAQAVAKYRETGRLPTFQNIPRGMENAWDEAKKAADADARGLVDEAREAEGIPTVVRETELVGGAPPSEPPTPPAAGVTGPDPDDIENELQHLRNERERILRWQAENPRPEVPPADYQASQELAGRAARAADSSTLHEGLNAFLSRARMAPEADPDYRTALFNHLVADTSQAWGGRRPVTAAELADEMNQTPEKMQSALDWMERMGLTTVDDQGRHTLTPLNNDQAQEYFDWLTQVGNMGDRVRPVTDNPELVEYANEFRRTALTNATDEAVRREITRRITEAIPEAAEGFTEDLARRAAIARRSRLVLDDLDDIADTASQAAADELERAGFLGPRMTVSRRGKERFGYMEGMLERPEMRTRTLRDRRMEEIGWSRDIYLRKLYERVSQWADLAAEDYARATELRSRAASLVRAAGLDEADIDFFADELLKARAPADGIGPTGPRASEYEEAVVTGRHTEAEARRLARDLQARNTDDGLLLSRRPWVSKDTGRQQMDRLAKKGFFRWIANTDDPAELMQVLGDLPHEVLRQLLVTTDEASARRIIEPLWGLRDGVREVPRLRRSPAQVLSGRYPKPAAFPKVHGSTLDIAADGPTDLDTRVISRAIDSMSVMRRRWMAEGGAGLVLLDRDNIHDAMKAAREWLDTNKTPLAVRREILTKMLMADDTIEAWQPIKNDLIEAFRVSMVDDGWDTELVDNLIKEWLWFDGQKQNFIADSGANPMATQVQGVFTGYGGIEGSESSIQEISAVFEADFARRMIVLPSKAALRRNSSAYRRFVRQKKKWADAPISLKQSAMNTILTQANSIWKDAALLRFGWMVKVVSDELGRMAAVGMAEFMSPAQMFALVAGRGDVGLLGGTWRDGAELMGGIGTGWLRDISTDTPLEGTILNFDKQQWRMGTQRDPMYWDTIRNRLEAGHHSPLVRMVAQRGVDEAFNHFTQTAAGQRHIAETVKHAKAGSALSKINDPDALRLVLEQDEALIAHLAGGKVMYRAPEPGAGRSHRDWRYNDGNPVPGHLLPRPEDLARPDVEYIILPGERGHDFVWDLVANGANGRLPEQSVASAIHRAEQGTSASLYYPIPAGDDTAIGNLGYEVGRITESWEEALEAAGERGRVAIISENTARRAINKARKTGDDTVDLLEDPLKVTRSSVDEYRANPGILDDELVPEATVHFDVQRIDEATAKAHSDKLRQLYGTGTKHMVDPETGREWDEVYALAPFAIPMPVTNRRGLPENYDSLRRSAYHVLTGLSDKISRTTFGKLNYWSEIARIYLYVPDPMRTTLAAKASASGMGPTFQRMITKQMREAGYRDLPKPRLFDLDLVDIEDTAMGFATRQVRDILYDQTKIGNISDAARLIAPFAEAFWEVITRWSKLMNPAYNPRALRNMRRIEQTFAEMQNGGWFQEDEHGNEVFRAPGAMSFLNNVGITAAFDPTSPLFFDPTSPAGMQPGIGPIVQLPAGIIIPRLPTWLQGPVTRTVFGDFPAPPPSLEGAILGVTPSIYKHSVTMLFSEQFRAALGDEMLGVGQALLASGSPSYDPRDPAGKHRLEQDMAKGGSLIGWLRILNAVVLPGQPRMEASMRIADDFRAGDITEEWIAVDMLREEWFSALQFFGGSQEAAYKYFIDRFGIDPFAFTSETFEVYDTPMDRDGYNFMIDHPEVREKAGVTFMAFMPEDPNGDFFSLAYQDAIRTMARQRVQPSQLAENYLIVSGYYQKNKIDTQAEAMRQQAEDLYGYGTEGYYSAARRITAAKAEDIARITAEFFGGDPQPMVDGQPTRPTNQEELAKLREIGADPEGFFSDLRELNPQYVDFLTILDGVWAQADARQQQLGHEGGWWMTAEYGIDAAGDVREANHIKEYVLSAMTTAYAQLTDPKARRAADWSFRNVVQPIIEGAPLDDFWIPAPARWPALDPADIEAGLDSTAYVPDGDPGFATVGAP